MPSAAPSALPMNVLVTGASSGIGQATARYFAHRGARTLGTSRGHHPDAHGVEMLQLDLSSDDSIHNCVREVLARCGHLDVLVNNAGLMHHGFAEETTPAEAENVFAANFFGTTQLTHALLPSMRARHQGRIINVGSLAAWVGEPGEAFYAASKAALARYTEALRHEVWHCGIKVSLVEPAAFTTGVVASAATATASIADYDQLRQGVRAVWHNAVDKGQDPRKVAALIWKIAHANAPRSRYGAGRGGHGVPRLKVLLPQRVFDYLLRRGFDLPPMSETK